MEYHGNDIRTSDELEEFGRLLVEKVRDVSISLLDRMLPNTYPADTDIARRWQKIRDEKGYEALIRTMIPDIVDETIAGILDAVDLEILNLSYKSQESGEEINLLEEGDYMLAGYYSVVDGWVYRYSKERSINTPSE